MSVVVGEENIYESTKDFTRQWSLTMSNAVELRYMKTSLKLQNRNFLYQQCYSYDVIKS